MGTQLHPSTLLVGWLAAVLAIQFLGYIGLGLLALGILISAPQIYRAWFAYLRRSRWLLLMLWVILAYNTPGESFQDLFWAPTYEGIAEANLHAVRLLLTLACLAWLFDQLGHERLLCALWGVWLPLQRGGLDIERLVVRLSLVLENLQSPPVAGAWKKMLLMQPDFTQGTGTLHLQQPVWHRLDILVLLLVALLFIGALVL